ncbi:DUF4082 domain-containing protein [Actinoallomurus spadix]|uniref:DUF4082 domain-containing protein n=1 Tax=Actinoallomurus spadix TaxID=79912 RepID=A0ABP3H5D9_9ACTN|nr:DUF4082 domain-containing protein [Actinoallomurus spadix]MCO5987763.1 DUF4082 domain-containing protein [Actinoallomurus spadix]
MSNSWLSAALAAVLSLGAIVMTQESAQAQPVSIGAAAPFAVLAGSNVTNTNLTQVIGDVGTSPGAAVIGFPPGTITGTIHAGDSTAANAKADVVTAYNNLVARTPDATLPAELGNTTRTPGVYNSTTGNFQINGVLTLDAQANPDAIFVFKAATLSAAMSSTITLTGGAQANNLYWVISDSATLDTFTTFRGVLIAANAINVNVRANPIGHLFTLNNAVTITGATSQPPTLIQVPDDRPTTTTLTSNNNPARAGEPITFTATVQPTSGSLNPQGNVAFKDGDTVIGTAFFRSTAQPATFTTSTLSATQHSITAVYLGGTTFNSEQPINWAPSTSPTINQVVSTGLWSSADVPDVPSHNDPLAVTLGVKFTASASGTVMGIRFYKGSGNTGTHVGSLWSTNGTLLGNATFTGESVSGWQQVNFSTPVAVTANTTYIASYFAPSGHYSVSRPYFTNPHANGPLSAPASANSGGNGVYAYGAANAFPSNTYQATNYWVDVVFTASS